MTLNDLVAALITVRASGKGPQDRGLDKVVLIINGIAYQIDQVWWEPRQGITGATCIGDDPR